MFDPSPPRRLPQSAPAIFFSCIIALSGYVWVLIAYGDPKGELLQRERTVASLEQRVPSMVEAEIDERFARLAEAESALAAHATRLDAIEAAGPNAGADTPSLAALTARVESAESAATAAQRELDRLRADLVATGGQAAAGVDGDTGEQLARLRTERDDALAAATAATKELAALRSRLDTLEARIEAVAVAAATPGETPRDAIAATPARTPDAPGAGVLASDQRGDLRLDLVDARIEPNGLRLTVTVTKTTPGDAYFSLQGATSNNRSRMLLADGTEIDRPGVAQAGRSFSNFAEVELRSGLPMRFEVFFRGRFTAPLRCPLVSFDAKLQKYGNARVVFELTDLAFES